MKYIAMLLAAVMLAGITVLLAGCGLEIQRHPIWADEAFDRQKNGN